MYRESFTGDPRADVTALPGRTTDLLVPNRHYFFTEATKLFEAFKGSETFILAYMDLRGFRDINNEIGHIAGNEALYEFYSRLRKMFRTANEANDTMETVVAREGGDEYLLLTRHAHILETERLKAAQAVERRIYDCAFEFEGFPITSRTSIVQSFPETPAETVRDLFARADEQLVRVRKAEKAGHSIHPLQGILEFPET